jgi:hypothetical protein
MSTFSFLPGPATTLVNLREADANRVLGILSKVDSFAWHAAGSSSDGRAWQCAVSPIDALGLNVAVCRGRSAESIDVLGIGTAVQSDQVEALARYFCRTHQRQVLIEDMQLDVAPELVMRRMRSLVAALLPAAAVISGFAGVQDDAWVPNSKSAHYPRWSTTDARARFKDLVSSALTQPQVIERDGDEVLVMGRELFSAIERPRTGAELASHFMADPLPPLRIEKSLAGPGRRFDLSDFGAAGTGL